MCACVVAIKNHTVGTEAGTGQARVVETLGSTFTFPFAYSVATFDKLLFTTPCEMHRLVFVSPFLVSDSISPLLKVRSRSITTSRLDAVIRLAGATSLASQVDQQDAFNFTSVLERLLHVNISETQVTPANSNDSLATVHIAIKSQSSLTSHGFSQMLQEKSAQIMLERAVSERELLLNSTHFTVTAATPTYLSRLQVLSVISSDGSVELQSFKSFRVILKRVDCTGNDVAVPLLPHSITGKALTLSTELFNAVTDDIDPYGIQLVFENIFLRGSGTRIQLQFSTPGFLSVVTFVAVALPIYWQESLLHTANANTIFRLRKLHQHILEEKQEIDRILGIKNASDGGKICDTNNCTATQRVYFTEQLRVKLETAYENAKLLQTQGLSLAESLMPEPSPNDCLSNLAGTSVISYGESSVYIFGGRGAEGPVSRTCLVDSSAETAWDEVRLINVSGEEPSPRWKQAACRAGGSMWVIGGLGFDDENVGGLFEFVLDQRRWIDWSKTLKQQPAPSEAELAGAFHIACNTDHLILIGSKLADINGSMVSGQRLLHEPTVYKISALVSASYAPNGTWTRLNMTAPGLYPELPNKASLHRSLLDLAAVTGDGNSNGIVLLTRNQLVILFDPALDVWHSLGQTVGYKKLWPLGASLTVSMFGSRLVIVERNASDIQERKRVHISMLELTGDLNGASVMTIPLYRHCVHCDQNCSRACAIRGMSYETETRSLERCLWKCVPFPTVAWMAVNEMVLPPTFSASLSD